MTSTESDAFAALDTFCRALGEIPRLDEPGLVERIGANLVDQLTFTDPVERFHAAFTVAVRTGELPSEAVDWSEHGVDEVLDFLARLLAELDRRRPWPAPTFVKVDPARWPTLGANSHIADIDTLPFMLEAAVNNDFDPVLPGEPPLLVLRLRTGQLIALVGAAEPDSTRFALVMPDAAGPMTAERIIEYMRRYSCLQLTPASGA